jgi:pimeloyl-ACP methyl ester carboxylesterase|nr:hybrid C-C meta-cleavage hydrolase-carboxylesterase [uncultured bacterium]
MKRFNLAQSLLGCTVFSVVLTTGCTNSQQDALYSKVIDLGRGAVNLQVEQAHMRDVDMTYLERKGSGPAVMLIHGFSANKDAWLKFANELPDDYHLIIPDLAGHGETPAPINGSYDLEQQAQRLNALVAHLGLTQLHIVGNSMGGAISSIYTTIYPEQIQSLTLMDAAGIDGANKSEYYQALENGHNPLIATDKESFENRMQMVMEIQPFLPWPLRPAVMRDTIERVDINREIFADMIATRTRLSETNFPELLTEKVKVPVLIMWGEKDRVLDVSAVPVFKHYLPQAKVVLFPEVGHVPMLEIPEKSANVLAEFIASIQ